MTSQPATPTSTVIASGDYAELCVRRLGQVEHHSPRAGAPGETGGWAVCPSSEHPAQAHTPRTGGWAETEVPVAQRILSGLLIQWSRVRFPGKQLAASSLPWPPSEQGETSTVACWSQEDMVLGPKLAARPGLPTVQPTVRAKLNTAQLFARTHDRTAGRPTRM